MATSYAWAFRTSLRRNAFGWRGTRKAIERLSEAVGEIERMARTDPALAGEGAVLLLEKLSPAVNQIDSSSGATTWVISRYNALGARGSEIQKVLAALGITNIQETKPEQFDALFTQVSALG